MIPVRRIARFLGILALICIGCIQAAAAAEHTVAPSGAEFSSIQAAVDRAFPGDIITVRSGTYHENILLDKQVSLIGIDSGSGVPLIEPLNNGNAVKITIDGCTLEGFTLRNSASPAAIFIKSDQNTIRNNTLLNNTRGIFLQSAMKNTLSGNTITDNNEYGIVLEESRDNVIEKNIIMKNKIGITLDFYSLSNHIFYNNFDNPQNVISWSPTSVWSSPQKFMYTYLGLEQQGYLGNFWSDYHGRDKNGNGVGDTPYSIRIGSNPKAIFESNQNTVDAFPLMDPTRYYSSVVPVTDEVIAPSTIPLPTIPGISGTVVTSPVPGNLTTVSPSVSSIPAEKPAEGKTTGLLMFELIVLLTAGLVVLVIFWQLKKGERVREEMAAGTLSAPYKMPAENSGHSGGASTVITPNSANPSTVLTWPSASPHEQKNYFPRELENKYYTSIRYIGRGGIAWVYSAQKKTDGIKVAVKIPISFDEMTGKAFLNEIAAWQSLRHPNIVRVTAVNILPVPYVEMEYVPGGLEALEKPVPLCNAVRLVRGIADGLRYAHEHGFIHRDIKPHNILLDEEQRPKITDWGMSKVLATDIKKSSIAGFSLSYAAPEQVSPSEFGRTDERTDIYQLGVVFYELVTGSVPFGGESIVEVGNSIVREQPVTPSKLNADAAPAEDIIMKCLQKDPLQRFQSAQELIDAISRLCKEEPEGS
jgi:parallel beta-helix repeat protein